MILHNFVVLVEITNVWFWWKNLRDCLEVGSQHFMGMREKEKEGAASLQVYVSCWIQGCSMDKNGLHMTLLTIK